MSTILAFDTATAACSVALWRDGEVSQRFEIAPRRHGELLLPMIDGLLKKAELQSKDCDAIAFGNGPGSFMGLRIAAGVAQGLAFGAGIPVIPVSTLRALAQTAYWEKPSKTILAGWDARMQQIYWGVYEAQADCVYSVIADTLTTPADVQLPTDTCLAAGNAWTVYADALPKSVEKMIRLDQDCYPSAKAVAFIAADLYEQGQVLEPESVELSYLRNRVAEKPKKKLN